jgi:hypothetical protein
MIAFLLFLLTPITFAHDNGSSEGRMLNASGETMECFFDRVGVKLTSAPVAPGAICLGDAIGFKYKKVFKIPNRSSWTCTFIGETILCEPDNIVDAVVFALAGLKHGQGGYGLLGWDDFTALMTGSDSCVLLD